MENKLITTGRLFYGASILCIGILQLCYPGFRPVILPAWHLPGMLLWVWLTGLLLIGSGIAIVTKRRAYPVTLLLGGFFLALFLLGQVPYELFIDPYSKHLGVWTNALKELALAGGAFVVADSLRDTTVGSGPLEQLIPLGRVFFSITMISFGLDHFYYTKGVSTLVPAWIPGALFWTYLAAVALIAAGIAIILKIKGQMAALLLSAMIFCWVILLHIPRAIADPFGAEANEIISVFEAVNFTGIALLIAYRPYKLFALPKPTL